MVTPLHLRPAEPSGAGKRRAWYRCGCGVEFVAQIGNVRSGNTTSCGCSRIQHGLSDTPIYRAWENMRQRVSNPQRYPTYVGVSHDPRWATFQGFIDNQPDGRSYEPGLCLARFGDVGDYTPENTRWLTRAENAAEQRHQPKECCKHGHQYTQANTKLGRDGTRRCRECDIERTRQWRARGQATV